MPLGTEVGLGPGDIVLDRNPAPPLQKGALPTQFWPMPVSDETACLTRVGRSCRCEGKMTCTLTASNSVR